MGNAVHSNKFVFGVEVPSFLSNLFNSNKADDSSAKRRYEVSDIDSMAVDDQCYLGKYGQMNECVDFDP